MLINKVNTRSNEKDANLLRKKQLPFHRMGALIGYYRSSWYGGFLSVPYYPMPNLLKMQLEHHLLTFPIAIIGTIFIASGYTHGKPHIPGLQV